MVAEKSFILRGMLKLKDQINDILSQLGTYQRFVRVPLCGGNRYFRSFITWAITADVFLKHLIF